MRDQTRLRSLCAIIAITLPPFFSFAADVTAQAQSCKAGARVQVEMIDGAIGTITEIGSDPPHVGWYRIVYDWNVRAGNPKGEWYNPKNREILVAGTNTKCLPADAAGKPQSPEKTDKTTPPEQRAAEAPIEQGDCPMSEPPGKITKTSQASAQLFKRVIYEQMAAKVNDKSIGAPKRIGLTFLEFELGKAYKNTLTGDRFADKRLHDGAPVGAMIYPIKTKYLRCELYDREIAGYVRQTRYACFKNRFGDWDCPVDSVTKTLERRTIPIK